MAKHNDTGLEGENLAVQFLTDKGYEILERNYRHRRAEVDIIALTDNFMVFIEVKTRRNNRYGYPEDSVDSKKQTLLIFAAEEYMYQKEYEKEFRFDIISITLEPELAIEHFEDAFFPGWEQA